MGGIFEAITKLQTHKSDPGMAKKPAQNPQKKPCLYCIYLRVMCYIYPAEKVNIIIAADHKEGGGGKAYEY